MKALSLFLLAAVLFSGCQRKLKPLLIETNYIRAGIGGELTSDQIAVYKYTLNKALEQPYHARQWAQPFGATIGNTVIVDDRSDHKIGTYTRKGID